MSDFLLIIKPLALFVIISFVVFGLIGVVLKRSQVHKAEKIILLLICWAVLILYLSGLFQFWFFFLFLAILVIVLIMIGSFYGLRYSQHGGSRKYLYTFLALAVVVITLLLLLRLIQTNPELINTIIYGNQKLY